MNKTKTKYPFEEGDDYWTIDEKRGDIVFSCWDDQSELFHDEDPDRKYFRSYDDARIVQLLSAPIEPIQEHLLEVKYRKKGGGLRLNDGKPRYDLLHPIAQAGLVRVLTKGSEKYAIRNWELGMYWSKVIASMKRHIEAFELGEDYDPETGELHIDHVQCNAHFLSAYYTIYPQGDDRPHSYLSQNKIGLDIDEVLADFVGGMMKKFPDMKERPIYWNDPHIAQNFPEIIGDDKFWLGLKAKVKELPFEPHCYITSRPCSTEITVQWLAENGFPTAPVYTVGIGNSKVDIAKREGIDIFVDDAYHNFVELNKAGVCTYLFTARHNERYDVGHKRINNLKQLVQWKS